MLPHIAWIDGVSDLCCLIVIRFKQTPTVSLDQPQISEWLSWLATHCLQKSFRQPLQLYMCSHCSDTDISVVALCVATTVFLVCSQVVWKWIDGKLTKLNTVWSSQEEPPEERLPPLALATNDDDGNSRMIATPGVPSPYKLFASLSTKPESDDDQHVPLPEESLPPLPRGLDPDQIDWTRSWTPDPERPWPEDKAQDVPQPQHAACRVLRQSTDDAEDALPLQPTTSQLPRPQDDQDDLVPDQSADDLDWAKLFSVDMSVPHAQDMPHTANVCTALASAGIPQVSERPMGWAVENGSKMRDVVHLSCHACLTPAEKVMHAANIYVFFANAKSHAVFWFRGPRTRCQGRLLQSFVFFNDL